MDFKKNKKVVSLVVALLILSVVISCKKKKAIAYPKSTNYGENIFTIPDGKLVSGESYSFEANLNKNATLSVEMTNLSENSNNQKPIWAFDFLKGWKAGNYTNENQTFKTLQVGNNDFKLVFVGTNGTCSMKVFENGSDDPAIIKNFTW